jgi:hypothetical protein
MMLDLFKSYKKFYQRWYIRKNSTLRESMKNVAHDIVKYLHENRAHKNEPLIRERALEMANLLFELEVKSRFENLISPEIIEAIQTGHYTIEIPYPVARRWNTEFMVGHVYVMTSPEMQDLSKLGATMMDLDLRANKYRNRYGYEVSLFFAKEFLGPFRVEKLIGEMIVEFRLNSKDDDHTNEWYRVSPDELMHKIQNFADSEIHQRN